MNILRLLVFTPSVTFGLLSSEIFPWALLYAFLNIKKIALSFYFWLIVLLPWFLYGFFYYGSLTESLVSIFAIINALTFIFLIDNLSSKEKIKLINSAKIVFFLSIILGIIQFLQVPYITDFISSLVPRSTSNFSALDGIASRGVSGLSSEPARQALELCLLLSLLLKTKRINYPFAVVLLFGLYMLFFNRSVTGLAFYSILLALFLIISLLKVIKTNKILKYAPLTIFSIFIGTYTFTQLSDEIEKTRSGAIVYEIIDSREQLTPIIINYSGFRFSSVYASYSNPTITGHGLGSSRKEIARMIKENDELYSLQFYGERLSEVGSRPTSLISSLLVEIGLLGIFLTLILMPGLLQNMSLFSPYNLLGFISLLFIGAAGNPIPIVVLFLKNE